MMKRFQYSILTLVALAIFSIGCSPPETGTTKTDTGKAKNPSNSPNVSKGLGPKEPEPENPPDSPLPDEPGAYNMWVNIDQDGVTERVSYSMYVPPTYKGEPVPFILTLHDGGGRIENAKHYGAIMIQRLIEPTFQEFGSIIVAPHSGVTGWGSKRNQIVVDRLIEMITEKYAIDETRTMVTGYSMGGSGTWFVAQNRGDFFKVAIPIAGRPALNDKEIKPALHVIHSEDDEIVDIFPTQEAIEVLKSRGKEVSTNFLKGLGHYEIPKYSEPLKESIPWVKENWGK